MQTRHRTPSVFNLSMVDVLCCALGCVILLWLLNLRNAKEEEAKVGLTSAQLKESRDEAGQLREQLARAEKQAQNLTAQLDATRSDRDRASQRAASTLQDLAGARARLADLDKESDALKTQAAAAAERLAQLTKQQRDLARDKADAARRIGNLEGLLRDKEDAAASASRRADALAERLQTAEEQAKQMRSQADSAAGLRGKLTATEARARQLEIESAERKKELADYVRRLDLLQGEKRQLADEARRARLAFENRFEGVELTGRRVVFLVDMSGSMELVDDKTPAPGKWSGVRATLLKILRSLVELEKFQVILFSDRVLFPLGPEGGWIDFDPKASADRVATALSAVKPRGDTDMHAALKAAFRLRPSGLDTIYLLSDGLPNIGEGLSAEAARKLSDPERAAILSQFIRRLLKTDWNAERAGQKRVRINTIGFFYESPDVGAFLWALARENYGSFVGMSRP
jgi:hypothetical protein